MNFNTFFNNLATFRGRTRRAAYWPFAFLYIAVVLGVLVCTVFLHDAFAPVVALVGNIPVLRFMMLFALIAFAILTTLPMISMTARRLHDSNNSGWWILVLMIPLLWVALVMMLLLPSSKGSNAYGPSPRLIAKGELSLEDFGNEVVKFRNNLKK